MEGDNNNNINQTETKQDDQNQTNKQLIASRKCPVAGTRIIATLKQSKTPSFAGLLRQEYDTFIHRSSYLAEIDNFSPHWKLGEKVSTPLGAVYCVEYSTALFMKLDPEGIYMTILPLQFRMQDDFLSGLPAGSVPVLYHIVQVVMAVVPIVPIEHETDHTQAGSNHRCDALKGQWELGMLNGNQFRAGELRSFETQEVDALPGKFMPYVAIVETDQITWSIVDDSLDIVPALYLKVRAGCSGAQRGVCTLTVRYYVQ